MKSNEKNILVSSPSDLTCHFSDLGYNDEIKSLSENASVRGGVQVDKIQFIK